MMCSRPKLGFSSLAICALSFAGACASGGDEDAGVFDAGTDDEADVNDITGTLSVTVKDANGVVVCTHEIISPNAPKLSGYMAMASNDDESFFTLTVTAKETADPPYSSGHQFGGRFPGRVTEPRDPDVVARTKDSFTELASVTLCQSSVGAIDGVNTATNLVLTSTLTLELSDFVGPARVTSETCPNVDVTSPCSSTEGHARAKGSHAFAFDNHTAVVEFDVIAPMIWVVSEPE